MRSRFAGLVAVALAGSLLTACSGSDAPSVGATAPNTAGNSVPSSATTTGADWPMYHGTPDHDGVSTTMPAATGPLRRTQSLKLDGAVFASPIVVHGLTIVATENDTVYAFDRSYRQVWKRNLGTPSPAEERQCGDIDPLGITGTQSMTPPPA